jgi:hypothetical protein
LSRSIAVSARAADITFAVVTLLAVGSLLLRWVWVLPPATAIYSAWYLVYGRNAVGELADPVNVVAFAFEGIRASIGHVSGLGRGIGAATATTTLCLASGPGP